VLFVRHRRARRYILRVLDDGTVRVTLPRWGARREAQAFLESSRDWITAQQQRRAAGRARDTAWRDGTTILFDGRETVLRVTPAGRGADVWCGEALAGRVSGAPRDVRPTVERWLTAEARRVLPTELLALAAVQGIRVARISVRNQRSRWGACSPTGTITLNWRLIQVPAFVRAYVLLHELMHRRELNHSRRFWRLVAACCPRHQEARRWLRTEGKSLWSDCDLR
jgi:predicted metal-dependent hydrolase